MRGQNFRLKINNMAINAATTMNYETSVDMEDTSSKDTTGNWKEETPRLKKWQGSCDSLMLTEQPIGAAGLIQLLGMVVTGTPLDCSFIETTGAQNRVNATSKTLARSGQLLINDLTVTFENGQTPKISFKFLGYGPLK